MDFKKAAMLGVEVWLLIFFEVSFLMFGAKLSPPSVAYYTIHFILLTFFLVLASLYYFNKTKSTKINGFYLGIVLMIVGVILDSIITVPLSAA